MRKEIVYLGDSHGVEVLKDDEGIWGLLEYHLNPNGGICGGFVPVEEGEWVVEQEHPLTVRPSLNCYHCPAHGFIRDGRWR